MKGCATQDVPQVVLVLDQREQFSRSIGGRQHNRVDALTECSRQLSNLGISVEVRLTLHDACLPCLYISFCQMRIFHCEGNVRVTVGSYGLLWTARRPCTMWCH